jgi:hypothetical protein
VGIGMGGWNGNFQAPLPIPYSQVDGNSGGKYIRNN